MSSNGPKAHIPGLDGLRGLAVVGVVAYHLEAPFATGGFLGVDLFMVLSGFLITRLLLAELEDTGRIDVGAFWVRRAKRLLPAALAFCVITAGLAGWLFRSGQLLSTRWDAIASVFYVANWRFVLAEQSYFDLFAEPSPFRHLWSLAIEEQFYVLWPLVVFAFRRSRAALLFVSIAIALTSVCAMYVFSNAADPSRAYYGTDTRVQTLVVGCILAILLHRRDTRTSPADRTWPALFAVPIAGLVVLAFVVASGESQWMYRGGFAVFAVLASLLVASVVILPGRGPNRLFELPPVRWVGMISYSLYLWHWPAIVFLTAPRVGFDGVWLLSLRILAMVGAAWLSFRFIESPIRHRTIAKFRAFTAVTASTLLVAGAIAVLTLGARPPADFFTANGTVATANHGIRPGVPPLEGDPAVLIVGDSVVASLSAALLSAAAQANVDLATAPVSGCGLLPGLTLDTMTQEPYENSRICADIVPAGLDAAFQEVRPDVVVWLSIWDAENREVGVDRFILETATGREGVGTLVDDEVDELRDRGASLVLLVTVPVVAAGDGPPPAAQKQERIEAFNSVLRSSAAARGDVDVIELAEFICPVGDPCIDVDDHGNRYRPGDGIHFEGVATGAVADWLVSEIRKMVS